MHVYFKSIALENVRCFGKKQTIEFTDKDCKPSMWNLILGENGVGKTTVLKGILSSWDQGEGQVKNSGANLNEVYFMRTNATASSIENELYIDNEDRNTSLHFIAVNVRGILATPRFYSTNLKKNDITLFAYGASRRIGDTGITEEQTSTISTLLDENASLINAEEWLAQSEYLSLKDKTQINLFNRVKTLLLRLFEGEISDIKIETNAQANKKISVLFQTHYGWVPLHQLSLGYKTMIGWMVDFARGLFDRYPDSTNPLAEPAVCLVDEIDLHLHPHFQRNLMRFLSDIFPKTQFIVTAHSPLV
ncbi:MAG: AAA family ATPase, partial [Saprospiraceae bacterium]|nr:AAA family ATPase [Saprospiraceae bacterium]